MALERADWLLEGPVRAVVASGVGQRLRMTRRCIVFSDTRFLKNYSILFLKTRLFCYLNAYNLFHIL